MKQRIEGYYDFQDGDVLKVNGIPVATVSIKDGFVQLLCNDDFKSKVYIGDKNTPRKEIDDNINCFWSGLIIAFNYSKKVTNAFLGVK